MKIFVWTKPTVHWDYPHDAQRLVADIEAGKYPGGSAGAFDGTTVPYEGPVTYDGLDGDMDFRASAGGLSVIIRGVGRLYRDSAGKLRPEVIPPQPGVPGLVIWVEEEYGYRDWRWDYPGTVEELVADWKAGKAPLDFFDPSEGDYRGTMTQVHETPRPRHGNAHVHMDDDTYLEVGGQTYDK